MDYFLVTKLIVFQYVQRKDAKQWPGYTQVTTAQV